MKPMNAISLMLLLPGGGGAFQQGLSVAKAYNASCRQTVTVCHERPLQRFESVLAEMPVGPGIQSALPKLLLSAGFESSSELVLFASDYVDASDPLVLSKTLQEDFGLSPHQSHICRVALFELVRETRGDGDSLLSGSDGMIASTSAAAEPVTGEALDAVRSDDANNASSDPEMIAKKPLFKSVVVNQKAKLRHAGTESSSSASGHQYGLPSEHSRTLPAIKKEIEEFMCFMTKPSASSQEDPIRETTARVYIRHANLFLGWYLKEGSGNDKLNMVAVRKGMDVEPSRRDENVANECRSFSIVNIFPDKDAASAQPIVDFILWLRRTRDISHSYEANVLRGLTKLLKFRFSSESTADPTYGEKSFHDIPAVRELRKLHRDANRRQSKSPRSSDEDRKWLSWEEYLGVVQALKGSVIDELDGLGDDDSAKSVTDVVGRRIATKYQRYLVLAFFSCIPDRQRTVRELELGRTFFRKDNDGVYIVKHGPDDYKTGATYGDRPPLGLSQELTSSIDDFLNDWREYLRPIGQHVFAQPRTGKPLTQDSVYSIVARSCYEHTGKKTNPHLLRDMIVTHVRDQSGASERDLEALALFMGHSVAMQRSSYDRRTMEQKVAPAVNLMKTVNEAMN